MSAVSTLLAAGMTGVDATDQTNVNNAMREIADNKLPLPHWMWQINAVLIARLIASGG